jgi:hypothetical protein
VSRTAGIGLRSATGPTKYRTPPISAEAVSPSKAPSVGGTCSDAGNTLPHGEPDEAAISEASEKISVASIASVCGRTAWTSRPSVNTRAPSSSSTSGRRTTRSGCVPIIVTLERNTRAEVPVSANWLLDSQTSNIGPHP